MLRALVLGDMLCAIPAIRALRRAAPRSEIILVGLPWARSFADRYSHYFNGFWEFPGFPALPEIPCDIRAFAEFLARAQHARLDLVIQLHGSGEVMNPIALLLGARRTAGFYRPGHCLPEMQWFFPYPESGSEVERTLQLVEHLGAVRDGDHLDFPLRDADFEELKSQSAVRELRPGNYVCLHPGARYTSRRWPIERFAAVGDALSGRGLQIVITGSPAEVELAESLSQAMKSPHINLAGATTLGSLAALLTGARLLICNDTGVSHLAAALRVPSVVIVTGSDPQRWAPLDRLRHHVVRHAVNCQPCLHIHCPIDHPCATGIEPVVVERAALEMLERWMWERRASRRVEHDRWPQESPAGANGRSSSSGSFHRGAPNGHAMRPVLPGRFDTDLFSERLPGVTVPGPE